MKTKLTILIAAITFQCLAASTVDTSKLYNYAVFPLASQPETN